MNILHVVADLHKGGGGTSEVIPRLARAQKELGHEVTLAGLNCEISDETHAAIESGVFYEGSSITDGLLPRPLGYSSSFRKALEPLVQKADIVHLHGLWMYPPWCAGWLAQTFGKPYVMMPHGFLEPARLRISKWKKRIVGQMFERPLFKHARAIIATAESEAEGIRAYGLQNPIHIMPIGLDCEKFRSCVNPGMPNDAQKKLLYFSRITPIKGLDMLADAWSRIASKKWKLLIVGPDDRGYTESIKKIYAEKCDAESYEFMGPVYGDDKYELLASVDAFVLPTRSENWSIAVAEAMASGLPVVCTKGAPWKCLETARAGWWCEISVEGIEAAIRAMMNLTDEERRARGANGRAWVERNLDWTTIAQNVINIYGGLL